MPSAYILGRPVWVHSETLFLPFWGPLFGSSTLAPPSGEVLFGTLISRCGIPPLLRGSEDLQRTPF